MIAEKKNKLIDALAQADYRTFAPGSTIMKLPATPATRVGYIHRGSVSCMDLCPEGSGQSTAHFLFQGDWVGLESLPSAPPIEQIQWKAVDVCIIAFINIDGALQEVSPILTSFLISAARQKHEVLAQVLCSTLSGEQRMGRILSRLASTSGEKTSDGTLIPSLNRSDLAQVAGVSREYVSRYLSRREKDGQLKKVNRGVLLK